MRIFVKTHCFFCGDPLSRWLTKEGERPICGSCRIQRKLIIEERKKNKKKYVSLGDASNKKMFVEECQRRSRELKKERSKKLLGDLYSDMDPDWRD